jgi:hypothetical protein
MISIPLTKRWNNDDYLGRNDPGEFRGLFMPKSIQRTRLPSGRDLFDPP